MVRKFWITNAKGQVFDMNRPDAFFANPEGLGTKEDDDYTQVGNHFIKTKSAIAQKTPQGYMYFKKYEAYDEFLNIIKFKPLILSYQPYPGRILKINVGGYELQKGEKDKNTGRLRCRFKMIATGTWYLSNTIYKNTPEQNEQKYPYTYPYSYVDHATGRAVINNNSNIDAYVRITIKGPVTNPSWTLLRDKQVIQDGRVVVSIPAGNRLVVDSDPEKYEIKEYDISMHEVENHYADSAFETDRFIYAPPGESILSITHEGSEELVVIVEVTELVE